MSRFTPDSYKYINLAKERVKKDTAKRGVRETYEWYLIGDIECPKCSGNANYRQTKIFISDVRFKVKTIVKCRECDFRIIDQAIKKLRLS